MSDSREKFIYCNFENIPDDFDERRSIRLSYEKQPDGFEPNMEVSLQKFIANINFLQPRLRDLLEIAAYIFNADRSFYRGDRNALEYSAWARKLHFFIKVRDIDFWSRPDVGQNLSTALVFMSGDAEYNFTFLPGRSTQITNLFDREDFALTAKPNSQVMLFSGGLDSLAGAVETLEKDANTHLYLVSHRSSQPSTSKTQKALIEALEKHYPKRIHPYKFYCHLRDIRARDENQRTRAFLFTSIAFSLSQSLGLDSIYVFENGVTAINFPKREDMGNARSSRTTHPKTIGLLKSFFSLVADSPFKIFSPFLWHTKAEVIRLLEQHNKSYLLSSAVSCSKTFRNYDTYTHCGECSQCIDRRFAAYALSLEDYDHSGLYTVDILKREISGEVKTLALDYIRASQEYVTWSEDKFALEKINELSDIVEFIDLPEDESICQIHELHKRHGTSVLSAAQRMISQNYRFDQPFINGSLLDYLVNHEFMKDPTVRLVEQISARLNKSIPKTFQRNKPINENDLNDKISGLLANDEALFRREYPAISFALAKTIPDHSSEKYNVLIETKYLRNSTSPSVASEGIAADLTKYPSGCYLLFIIYDPDRAISDDDTFQRAFEEKRPGYCKVFIVR